MKDPVTWLYPPVEPYRTDRLRVSPVHELYFEESGNLAGKPVVFLHGGPGGGSDPKQRRFFHPAKYRIICFDQRGCVHVTMDLYRYAYKIAPWVRAELIADAFELAWRARELDMRASP